MNDRAQSRPETPVQDRNGAANVTAVEAAAINAIAPADASAAPSITTTTRAAASPSSSASASGFSTTLQQAVVQANGFATVTLGQMIANRMNSSATATLGTSGSISGITGIAGGQVPGIVHGTGGAGAANAPTSLDVPEVLQAYGNGRIPKEMLTPIGIGQHRMWSVAAGAFTTMRAAAAADGVDIGVTDSYRSYDQQVELAANKGLYKNGGLAAVPGTSPHGWGLALDVDVDPKGLAWLRANGATYGFAETTPREPWHWEFRGTT